MIRLFAAALLALTTLTAPRAEEAGIGPLTESLIFGRVAEAERAARLLGETGDPGAIGGLIFGLRFAGTVSPAIEDALRALSGAEGPRGWFQWMLWQEANPQITPDPSLWTIKRAVYRGIDPAFERFLKPEHRAGARIRIEEIAWGGVRVDGIPSLDDPETLGADAAGYLNADDLVFGVALNGEAMAWPLRILGWHEMSNATVGGVRLALAYCTLCGAGVAYETAVEGRAAPFTFSTSGFLYRSNKLMYDRQTDTLWNQFTGEPVIGPLAGSGIRLRQRPVVVARWADWRAANPRTRVLSLDTGHRRDYGAGVVYRDYFASPDMMFPARADESRFAAKSFVFGMQAPGASRAWPLEAFAGGAVINDSIGDAPIVLVGDAASRSVRSYDRGARRFAADGADLRADDGRWRIAEEALIGPKGERLARRPGHIAYWFAWNSFLGVESTLYGAEP